MASTRIFQDQAIYIGANIQLDEKAAHHVARVLRAKIGNEIILFNNQGMYEYQAVIIKIDRKQVLVRVQSCQPKQVESSIDIQLAQCIARAEKMDWIIQKTVELGVKKIWIVFSERSTVKLNDKRKNQRLAHWQAVALHACEQSGRVQLPEIMPPMSYTEFVKHATGQKFICRPNTSSNLPSKLTRDVPAILLIGPEGGFSQAEIQAANDAQFQAISFGPRILRTETAAISAVTIFQFNYGDMSIQVHSD